MATNTIPSLHARDFQSAVKPIWCSGCGHFGVLSALTKAFAYLERPAEEIAVVSGIGCSSRLPAYLSCYGFHGLHGRALPLATGLKLARPDLCVIAAGGDGDGFSIGTNHFVHACRRNLDVTYLVMDNKVYGMTKGQASPTTAADWTGGGLTPWGTGLAPLQPAAIAAAAGAGFIARGFSGDPHGLSELMVRAILHPGFAFVHILSPCRTFRAEDQAQWKRTLHPIRPAASDDSSGAPPSLLGSDDDALGVLYERVGSPPNTPRDVPGSAKGPLRHDALAEIEAELQYA
jgi:2-oxoglutarate ferredoxin oxidoreductase subunit beta